MRGTTNVRGERTLALAQLPVKCINANDSSRLPAGDSLGGGFTGAD
ncbi:MAG: hypothetical protein RLZZ127_2576 [Planctomycetota bacterium]|jgi:hypothetical protein